MGEIRSGWHPVEEEEREDGHVPALTDPLQVPDVFATNAEIELLRDHARITHSAVRRNEFGEPTRPVVGRTVMTMGSLFACIEDVMGALLDAPDPDVQRRLLELLGRMMKRLSAPPCGGRRN